MSDLPLVALFIPSLEGGGVRRVMVNLAQGFAGAGLPVDMVLAEAKGSYLSQLPPEVRIVDLNSRRVGGALPALIRYLRRARPKALLSGMEHANLVALMAKSISGVPVKVVVSVHALYSREIELFPHRRNRTLIPFLVRRLYPRAYGVIAVSESVAADLVKGTGLPREKIRVIFNPVVTPRLREQLRETLNDPWFNPTGPPVILSTGRLTAEKDFASLIRAFHILRGRGGASAAPRLVILGEGPRRGELEELAHRLGLADYLRLPGFISNPYPYMARAAVFVLSSRREGFGNVLVEALAAGTPVVSTHCPGGPQEILEGGRYGRLAAVGDTNALAEAIRQTLNTPPDRSLLRQRAEEFSIERILPLYREVLNV